MPTVVFCTTCKDRTEHLERTLPRNLRDNADHPHCTFVVLNYNSRDHLEDFLRSHQADVDAGRLAVYRFTEPTPFRMAHAKNLAHRLGMREGGDVLVNLDADNYTGEGFAAYLAEMFREPGVFGWANMVKGELPRGISGRIAVSREAFLVTGGYDERYAAWGPDDKDFNQRLRRLGFAGREIDRRFLGAILHNDKVRFRDYPQAQQEATAEDFELHDRAHVTVANAGRVGLGVVYRNFDRHPIEIGPLPTRVFGIGMHKTATTSLHAALETLGLPCAHWPSAHWAKAVWQEMTAYGRSPTLERHYAACDLPLALLYQQLDRAYPGAKFVLTLRDETEWLQSVRDHWDPRTNPFRAAWDTDPFSHQVHLLLYGRRQFDPEVMLARYRRHNAEVREYFKDRPQDLLVMDFSQGAGWYELCGFLRQPIPDGPFPRRNGTVRRASA